MSLFRFVRMCVFVLPVFFATFANGATRRVDSDSPNNGPGNDWAHAYWTVQAAVSASSPNDIIWVAGGTTGSPKRYKPVNYTTPIDLKDEVSIQGGYAGYGAGNPDARDVDAYPTEFSGDLGEEVFARTVVRIPDGTGAPTGGTTFADKANLDGVSVTGGWGGTPASFGNNRGAGLLAIDGSSGVIRQCVIHDNTAQYGGGAFVEEGAEVILRKCRFESNGASEGGGLAVDGEATLLNCIFYDNHSSIDGGGVKCVNWSYGTVTVVNCTFDSNTASNGGGISVKSAAVEIQLINSVFFGNTASTGGAIHHMSDGDLEITNCTVSGNEGSSLGGGLYFYSGSTASFIKNSIFWDNEAAFEGPEIYTFDEPISVSHSDIKLPSGTYAGTDNINSNPLFINAGIDDYRVQCGSQCINKCTTTGFPADSWDVNENPSDNGGPTPDRNLGNRDIGIGQVTNPIDMGAYERVGPDDDAVCLGDVQVSCVVDVDDLLMVINGWGTPGNSAADTAPAPCGNGVVDVDDLLVIINNWGACPGCTDESGITLQDAEDCMDAASLEYEPFSAEWDDVVNKCVEGLRAAGLIP
jgi:predicted outer membrane repeat protein